MANDTPITITIKDKVYTVPRHSRVEELLMRMVAALENGGGSGSGSGIPDGYTIGTDEDIDNLFP